MGGCGPSGQATRTGNIHDRISMAFGELLTGKYTAKAIVSHETQPQIILTEDFFILKDSAREAKTCSFTGSQGICLVGNKQYRVKRDRCGLNVDVEIRLGSMEEKFSNIRVSDTRMLSTGDEFRVTGAPCSASNFNIEFLTQTTITNEGTYKVNEQSHFNIKNQVANINQINTNNIVLGFEDKICTLNYNNHCQTKNNYEILNFTLLHIQNQEAVINVDYLKEIHLISPQKDNPLNIVLNNSKEIIYSLESEDLKYVEIDEKLFLCQGCVKQNTCYPQEFRLEDQYCFENDFLNLKIPGEVCTYNFECENNECESDICKQNILQKVTSFLKGIFG